MNLMAYDIVTFKKDYSNYIDTRFLRLYSKTIKYRPYYTLLKRYSKGHYKYYIALLDEEDTNNQCYHTELTKSKQLKIDLDAIWKDLCIDKHCKEIFIKVKLEVSADDGEIYLLDI